MCLSLISQPFILSSFAVWVLPLGFFENLFQEVSKVFHIHWLYFFNFTLTQLALEQHRFELHGSAYMWTFFFLITKYVLQHSAKLVQFMHVEDQLQSSPWIFDCIVIDAPHPVLFKGQLYNSWLHSWPPPPWPCSVNLVRLRCLPSPIPHASVSLNPLWFFSLLSLYNCVPKILVYTFD